MLNLKNLGTKMLGHSAQSAIESPGFFVNFIELNLLLGPWAEVCPTRFESHVGLIRNKQTRNARAIVATLKLNHISRNNKFNFEFKFLVACILLWSSKFALSQSTPLTFWLVAIFKVES